MIPVFFHVPASLDRRLTFTSASGCAWQVGKVKPNPYSHNPWYKKKRGHSRVSLLPAGHETYPVYKQAENLRVRSANRSRGHVHRFPVLDESRHEHGHDDGINVGEDIAQGAASLRQRKSKGLVCRLIHWSTIAFAARRH